MPGGSCHKGVQVPIGVAGGGVGVGSGGWRCGFPVEYEGKGEGGGEGQRMGWGQAKELASQCAGVCQDYPLPNYPLVSSRNKICSYNFRLRDCYSLYAVALALLILGFFSICICSLTNILELVYCAAAVLEFFRISFA